MLIKELFKSSKRGLYLSQVRSCNLVGVLQLQSFQPLEFLVGLQRLHEALLDEVALNHGSSILDKAVKSFPGLLCVIHFTRSSISSLFLTLEIRCPVIPSTRYQPRSFDFFGTTSGRLYSSKVYWGTCFFWFSRSRFCLRSAIGLLRSVLSTWMYSTGSVSYTHLRAHET